jgi:hypothetical protein
MPGQRTVKECVKQLQKHYDRDPTSYLTESDISFTLSSMLRKRKPSNSQVHCELRPYIADHGEHFVIRNCHWKKQRKANEGSTFDIAIVRGTRFWKEALRKARKDQKSDSLRYWRILSYPVESFLSAIEVKARVNGNIEGIKKDVDKLVALHSKNRYCFVCLVVMDRKAKQNDVKEILAHAKRHGSFLHTMLPHC